MTEKTPGGSKGLIESLTTLAATLVTIAHKRLDLCPQTWKKIGSI